MFDPADFASFKIGGKEPKPVHSVWAGTEKEPVIQTRNFLDEVPDIHVLALCKQHLDELRTVLLAGVDQGVLKSK